MKSIFGGVVRKAFSEFGITCLCFRGLFFLRQFTRESQRFGQPPLVLHREEHSHVGYYFTPRLAVTRHYWDTGGHCFGQYHPEPFVPSAQRKDITPLE